MAPKKVKTVLKAGRDRTEEKFVHGLEHAGEEVDRDILDAAAKVSGRWRDGVDMKCEYVGARNSNGLILVGVAPWDYHQILVFKFEATFRGKRHTAWSEALFSQVQRNSYVLCVPDEFEEMWQNLNEELGMDDFVF